MILKFFKKLSRMQNVDGILPKRDTKFPDGSILKICFKDFLTYENAELTPGENLNLIIGTNGAGKSTVICGICLAVGGSPKILGRSERMTDYIKHGKESGYVELFIEDAANGVQRMKIALSRSNNCEYFINGQKSTQAKIRALAASYNIQIDNPCTFLAQDKVKTFSEQNPVELLRNTEKAGDAKLLERHDELIAKKHDFGLAKQKVVDLEEKLQEIDKELERLKPRIDNFYQKQDLDSKIHILRQKQIVIEYSEEYAKYSSKKEELDKIDEKVNKLRENVNKIINQIEKTEQKNQSAHRAYSQASHTLRETTVFLQQNCRQDYYKDKLNRAKEQLRNVKNAYEEYEQDLANVENDVSRLSAALEEAKNNLIEAESKTEDREELRRSIQEETDRNEEEESNIRRDLYQFTQERRAFEDSVRSRRTTFDEKLHHLNTLNARDVVDAWQWVCSHEDSFEHPIYVPFLHICVPRDRAKFLEALIPFRDSTMFICGSRRDETVLAGQFPRINTTVVSPNAVNSSELTALCPSRLQQLGFQHYCVELFKAPDVVKQYLCNVYMLHKTPVGNETVNNNFDVVVETLSKHNMRVFLTDTQRCQITLSRYSGENLTSSSPIRPPRMYLMHSQAVQQDNSSLLQEREALLQKEEKIKQRSAELMKRKEKFERRKEEIRSVFANIRKKKEEVEKIKTYHANNLKKLELKRKSKPDVAAAEAAFEAVKEQISGDTAKHVKELIKKMEKLATAWADKELLRKHVDRMSHNLEKSKTKKEKLSLDLMELLDEQQDMKGRCSFLRRSMMEAKQILTDLCKLSTTDEAKMTPQEKEIWQNMQKNFEKLKIVNTGKDAVEKQLAQEQAKKKLGNRDGSKEDVQNYEKLKKSREELSVEANSQTAAVQKFTTTYMQEIEEWKKPVKELVTAINKNYSKFFDEIGCVGEVHLEEPPTPTDIDLYGIMIMVSFRSSERLRRLDHQVQSGGERSVSTMLYLLALQELCPVPFRCVDEINQGMDPTNERKVFDIMVKKLTGDGSLAKTQYFLLTPKLLHDLTYNEKVTIQVVHNSRALSKKAHKWNVDKIVEKMRS